MSPVHVELRDPGALRARIRSIIVALCVGAGVVGLALDHGSFDVVRRGELALLAGWALVLGILAGVLPRDRVPRGAVAVGRALLLLAAVTALSLAWAPSAEGALWEVDRVVLYLGVFVLTVVAMPRDGATPVLDGLSLGLVGVALLALAGRLFPSLRPDEPVQLVPALGSRLSYPVGYWNGLAVLVALALPLLLQRAATFRGRGGAAVLAGVPAIAAVLVLSASRTGALTAVAGAVAFLVVGTRKRATTAALIATAAAAIATYVVLRARPELLNAPAQPGAGEQGHSAALLLVAIAVATPFAYLLLRAVAERAAVTGPQFRRGILVGGLLLVVLGIAVAHPLARVHAFTAAPDLRASSDPEYVQRHLLAGSGSGRWQMWQKAVDELAAHPLKGGGAGSYGAWWTQHRPFALASSYAHSLYLQTGAELGVLGLVALLGVLLTIVLQARERLLHLHGDRHSQAAALIALLVAFAFAAAVDWMWEITVVGVVVCVALGLLFGTGLGRAELDRPQHPLAARRRLVLVALVLGLGAAQALPWLAELRLRTSASAAQRRDAAAAYDAALDARSLTPWAASPRVQLALLDEQAGRLALAARTINEAIARDPDDWRLWFLAARIDGEWGDRPARAVALARLQELDPWLQNAARATSAG